MQTSKGHEDIMITWGFIDLFFSLVTSCALKVTVSAAAVTYPYGLVHLHVLHFMQEVYFDIRIACM